MQNTFNYCLYIQKSFPNAFFKAVFNGMSDMRHSALPFGCYKKNILLPNEIRIMGRTRHEPADRTLGLRYGR